MVDYNPRGRKESDTTELFHFHFHCGLSQDVEYSPLCYMLLLLSCFSHVQLFVTQWTVAHQAPMSMGFSRQEYWSGLPFPSPGDRPDPGIEPGSPILQADTSTSEPPGKPSIQT